MTTDIFQHIPSHQVSRRNPNQRINDIHKIRIFCIEIVGKEFLNRVNGRDKNNCRKTRKNPDQTTQNENKRLIAKVPKSPD